MRIEATGQRLTRAGRDAARRILRSAGTAGGTMAGTVRATVRRTVGPTGSPTGKAPRHATPRADGRTTPRADRRTTPRADRRTTPRADRRTTPRADSRASAVWVLGRVGTLAVCGGLAGAVIAAAAFPTVALGGLGARAAAEGFQDLPSELTAAPLALTSTLYARNNAVITTFYDQNRVNVALGSVAPVMRQAIVAAEDSRFYEHRGVDPRGIVRALVANQQEGEVAQGASTLTQQYVRQYLVYTAKSRTDRTRATERTAARKLREMRYAIGLEQQLSKDKILENYLNIAYFGAQSYGVHAAARTYFSKAPGALTLGEAALLAGLVQSPGTDSPIDGNAERATARRNYTLQRMAALGLVTPEQAAAAQQAPIRLTRAKPRGSCATGRAEWGFYCDWFLGWWRSNPAFGKTPNEREAALRRGGYAIHTALDPRMQTIAQRAADRQVRRSSRFATGIVLVEPGTGRVRAMAVTRTYSIAANPRGRPYPNTVNPLLTGSGVSPGYQAGSTFKLFTLVAALRKGMPLDIRITAPDRYRSRVFREGGAASCGGWYCPQNASRAMAGSHSMWSGLGESVNTFFVQLEERVTVRAAVSTAEQLGVRFRADADVENKRAVQRDPNGSWGSFTLGTALVSPLDMANAYATVAARGRACAPLPVDSITDRLGRPVAAAKPSCRQVMSRQVADAAADAARCPVGDPAMGSCSRRNGVTARSVGTAISRPVAGKSGTTDGNRSAWFVGFTPNLAGAAFYVDPDAPSTSSVPTTTVPVSVFKEAMSGSLRYLPVRAFVRPTAKLAYGVRRTVPDVDGLPAADAARRVRAAGFAPSLAADPTPSAVPRGRVTRTDPAGGSRVAVGSSVIVYVSTVATPTRPTRPRPPPRRNPIFPLWPF